VKKVLEGRWVNLEQLVKGAILAKMEHEVKMVRMDLLASKV
jgi:hypothetical protein